MAQAVAQVPVGKYAASNQNKSAFHFDVTAVTVPVIASGLVSVFTLWNPPGSGVFAELIETAVGQVLATTVVDSIGWYASSAAATALGTFTTRAIANTTWFTGRIWDPVSGGVIPHTAYTHSGTPVRVEIIGAFGGVTDIGFSLPDKLHDGKLLLPPGIAMSVAMSTAAGFTAGLDLHVSWVEFPWTP
jgi:hypothetical protein